MQNYETEEAAHSPKPGRTHHHGTKTGGLGVCTVQKAGAKQSGTEGLKELGLRRRTWGQRWQRLNSCDTPDESHQGRPLVHAVRGLHDPVAPRPSAQLPWRAELGGAGQRQAKVGGGTGPNHSPVPRWRRRTTVQNRQKTAAAAWRTDRVRQVLAPAWRSTGAHKAREQVHRRWTRDAHLQRPRSSPSPRT